jgi:hypothetical protein
MAFFLARRASARLPARLGVGVLLRLPSEPFAPFKLIPESRCCRTAGFRPAAGRFPGGCGGVGFDRIVAVPFCDGGGGGNRGAGAGAGACSST